MVVDNEVCGVVQENEVGGILRHRWVSWKLFANIFTKQQSVASTQC